MMIQITNLFVLLVLLGFTTASVRQLREGSDFDYGYEAMKKRHGFNDFTNRAHENSDAWKYMDNKADETYAHASSLDEGAHESEALRRAAARKSNTANTDYGRDVKTKTYGFFNYQYIKPQFHIEQYHVDEKHTNKHSSDAHSTHSLRSSDENFRERGRNNYAESSGSEVSKKSLFGRDSHEHGFRGSRYDHSHGDDEEGGFEHGYHLNGMDYGSQYDSHRYGHGHHPDFGKHSGYPGLYHHGASPY